MTKKISAIILAVILIVNLAGCGAASTDTGSSQLGSSTPSDTSSVGGGLSSQGGIGGDLGGTKTEPPSQPSTDSLWGNPENYTIVYAEADANMKKVATKVQRWFSDNYRCTIPIMSDKNAETELEILIGNTNRKESGNKTDGSYKVSVQGKKLVFDGYHSAIVELAVKEFLEANPKTDEAAGKISGKISDFKASMYGYDYVWGDEFEGDEVDFSKWSFDAKMGAYADARIATDRDVIDVKSGKLVLRSMVETSKGYKKNGIDYKMPTSVVTQHNMMYTYGYCEIKAKVPTTRGTWPSFWLQSRDGVGERKCFDYMVEVDVFEVFGTTYGDVIPNLHKWYDSKYYNYGQIHNVKKNDGSYVMNTSSGSDKKITLKNEAGGVDGYHVYGYEWTPTHMRMYFDGRMYKEYDINKTWDKATDMRGFHDPQYIIFNNHLFTDKASYKPNLIEGNEGVLPSEYIIEYFRLYQKKGEGKIWIDEDNWKTYSDRT